LQLRTQKLLWKKIGKGGNHPWTDSEEGPSEHWHWGQSTTSILLILFLNIHINPLTLTRVLLLTLVIDRSDPNSPTPNFSFLWGTEYPEFLKAQGSWRLHSALAAKWFLGRASSQTLWVPLQTSNYSV